MSKSKSAPVAGAVFHMLGAMPSEASANTDAGALDGLLSDLQLAAGDEIEEVVGETAIAPADGSDEILEEVEESADAIAARQELYQRQGESNPEHLFGQPAGDKPATEPEAVAKKGRAKLTDEEKAARKAERERIAAEKKAARDAEKAAKPARPTSITHKPGDLLVAKLGSNWREYVVFTDVSAGDTIALEREQDAFIERMNDRDAIADKVRDKIIMLFTWLKDGGTLNEVMRRAFTVLHEKGELTSGDKGNLQLNLLAKPYSLGTARSQANQMFMAFPELGLTVKEKGRMVANPNSLLLPLVYDRLGLGDGGSGATPTVGAASTEGADETAETVEVDIGAE